MGKDPRSEFMALSQRLADGLDVEITRPEGPEPTSARERFIRDSQMLAAGHSPRQVRALYDAADGPTDPRERFIRDSQRLAEGLPVEKVAPNRQAARQARQDARRFASGRLLNLDEKDADEDPREALLKKLSAMADM